MNKLLTRIAITSLCLVPSIVSAAVPFGCYEAWMIPQARQYAPQGWFFGATVGFNKPFRSTLSPQGDYTFTEQKFGLTDMGVRPASGLQAGFLWGYRYHSFRFESDIMARRNQISTIRAIPIITAAIPNVPPPVPNPIIPNVFDTTQINNEGLVTSYSFMFNFIYDHYFTGSCLYPFIGLGFGVTFRQLNADLRKINYPGPPQPNIFKGPKIDERFLKIGLQFLCGLGYVISDTSEISLTYRYFSGSSDGFSIKKNNFNIDNNNARVAEGNFQIDFDYKYVAQSLGIDFRWS